MNNMRNSQNDDNILNNIGKQLGESPDQLLKKAQNGQYDALLNKMKPQDAQKFKQVLNNPVLAEQMLKSPQAQMLLKQFLKNNGN